VTTGSSNPAYSAYSEKDATSATVLQYQSISCTPAYRGSSFEVR
jgi:nuclear pore complex protein Nup98-Nup96